MMLPTATKRLTSLHFHPIRSLLYKNTHTSFAAATPATSTTLPNFSFNNASSGGARNLSTLTRRTGPGFSTRLQRKAIFARGIRKGPNRRRWEDGTCVYVKKCGLIKKECLEAIRMMLVRHLRKYKSNWEIYVYPRCIKPITRKPLNVRMGKGKAPIKFFAAAVKTDDPFIEIRGVRMDVVEECIRIIKVRSPLPLYTRGVVEKNR